MYFLLNDLILDIDATRMMQPLDADRFSALSADYIAQLGKEMFAEDVQAHRNNPERARRLAYLIHLKMPRINADQFFVTSTGGGLESGMSGEGVNSYLNGYELTYSYSAMNKSSPNQRRVLT